MLWRFFLSIDLVVGVFLEIFKSAKKDGIFQFEQGLVGSYFEGLPYALAQGALPQGNDGFGLKNEAAAPRARAFVPFSGESRAEMDRPRSGRGSDSKPDRVDLLSRN